MDETGNAGARLRLPKSFGESDDPVEGNPFPPEHPAHQVWLEATRRAQAAINRISADAFLSSATPSSLTPGNADEWMQTLVLAKFDVWAERGATVWPDAPAQEYARWLVGYANAWLDAVSQVLASHSPVLADGLLADLRARLASRVQHWRAEAHARAAAQVQRPPSAELVQRRRSIIQKHRAAHGLTAVGFARSIGMSDTGVRGIVREDWTRFNRATQERLLKALAVSREEWYRE